MKKNWHLLICSLVIIWCLGCNTTSKSPSTTVNRTIETTDCIDTSKISKGPCTKEFRPVCGCDDKTYDNECFARIAGLKSWTAGPCNKNN